MKQIETVLHDYLGKGGVGIQLSIARDGEVPATYAAGIADRDTQAPVICDHLFKIGSCTKTFVAASLFRLAEERGVDLDASIQSWFPDVPFAKDIQVIDLINHRSGLPEFEYDIPMVPGLDWTPREIVDFAYKVATASAPHKSAVYSNTGFVMAGILIEEVTGRRLGQWVRESILEPLGLKDSWSPASEAFPAEKLVRGHYLRSKDLASRGHFKQGGEMWNMEGLLAYSDDLQDSSDLFAFPLAYACGDMIASTADQATFMSALIHGELLSRSSRAKMLQNMVPVSFPGTRMIKAGAGVFESSYGGRLTIGHQGSVPGYVSVMQHDPASGVSVAVATNVGSGDRLSFQAAGLHPLVDEIFHLL